MKTFLLAPFANCTLSPTIHHQQQCFVLSFIFHSRGDKRFCEDPIKAVIGAQPQQHNNKGQTSHHTVNHLSLLHHDTTISLSHLLLRLFFYDLQIHMALVSVITSSLVWFHSLCLLVLPVDLGGWQSHPAQPDRLLETEQPSSLHWTHKTDQTSQNNTCGQNRHRGTHAHTHMAHSDDTTDQTGSDTATHPFHGQRKRVGGREVVWF